MSQFSNFFQVTSIQETLIDESEECLVSRTINAFFSFISFQSKSIKLSQTIFFYCMNQTNIIRTFQTVKFFFSRH